MHTMYPLGAKLCCVVFSQLFGKCVVNGLPFARSIWLLLYKMVFSKFPLSPCGFFFFNFSTKLT